MSIAFGTRRAEWVKLADVPPPLAAEDLARFEAVDLFYRSLCALLYNYVPMSGHPGGSISSGRFVAGILFDAMDYDLAKPDRADADIVSYAAGHKAMGLYSMWALRDELARVGNPAPAADGRGRAPAPRGPARLPPQPDERDPALPQASARRPSTGTRPRPRRSSSSRPAPRASGSRARSASPWRRATTTGRRPRASTWSRARAASPRAAWPRRWPPPAPPLSTTSSSTWTGTRPRSTRTACAARTGRPATTCSGRRWSSSTCTTGT